MGIFNVDSEQSSLMKKVIFSIGKMRTNRDNFNVAKGVKGIPPNQKSDSSPKLSRSKAIQRQKVRHSFIFKITFLGRDFEFREKGVRASR